MKFSWFNLGMQLVCICSYFLLAAKLPFAAFAALMFIFGWSLGGWFPLIVRKRGDLE